MNNRQNTNRQNNQNFQRTRQPGQNNRVYNQQEQQERHYHNTQQKRTQYEPARTQNQPQYSTPQQQQKVATSQSFAKPQDMSGRSYRDRLVLGNRSQNTENDFSYGANIPTNNMYQRLSDDQPQWSRLSDDQPQWSSDGQPQRSSGRQSLAGKTKQSSPLDADIYSKRQREYTSDDSRNSDTMECDKTSRDNTASANGITVTQTSTTHL